MSKLVAEYEKKCIFVSAGEDENIGNVRISVFESDHSGVDEYGYVFEYNGEKIVMPVDVRNYNSCK